MAIFNDYRKVTIWSTIASVILLFGVYHKTIQEQNIKNGEYNHNK